MSDEASVDRLSDALARALPAGGNVAEVLDATMDAILLVDARHHIMLANTAAGRVFGHPPEAMTGASLSLLIPRTARPLHDRQVSDFLRNGRSERGHRAGLVTGLHADGRELALDITISRIPTWVQGAAVAVIRDASDRLAQEQALRDSDLRFRLIASASGDVLYEWRRGAPVSWFGDALARVLGQDPAEARSIQWWRANIHPDDRMRVLASWRDFLSSSNAEWTEEYRLRRGDGSYAVLINRSTSARDETGRVVQTVGALMDVTALRASEAARLTLEAQLQQSQKMEAIGRLAGGIAHDFNNLLTVIIGNTTLVKHAVRDREPIGTELDDTLTAAQRAADLTRQLLAFARRQVVTPRIVELNSAAQQTMRLVQRLLGEGIEVIWGPSNTPLYVRVDPSQFELVLVNLAVNARDAMPGGGTLTVQLTEASPEELALPHLALPEDRRYARCEVRDSGTGIPPESLPHIFEPFYTTKDRGKGTGLGLSICYGIVQQAGGHIDVRSRMGDGTAFVFYLPLTDEREPRDTAGGGTPIARGSETLLLVEDEPKVLALFSTVLRRQGYQVLAASTPDDALALMEARQQPVDLLVSDVALPRMSGVELAELLRARALVRRVLFVSGHAEALIDGSGELPPGSAFLGKPLTGDLLAAKVRELLDLPAERR